MVEHITLRTYTELDYQFVYEIKKSAYQTYVEMCWGEWMENSQREYFEKFIRRVKENSYIIQYDSIDIGFYNGEISTHGSYKIENICIFPEYQGRGIGTELLKGVLKKYCDFDVETQYFKQNPVGSLYRRLGFEKIGETDFHYQVIKAKKSL